MGTVQYTMIATPQKKKPTYDCSARMCRMALDLWFWYGSPYIL